MRTTATILIFLLSILSKSYAGSKYATLCGASDSLKNTDSVTLIIDKYGAPNFREFHKTYGLKIVNHRFSFTIPSEKFPIVFHLYFNGINDNQSITNYKDYNIPYGLITAGDSMSISYKNGKEFSGIGSQKMIVIRHFEMLFENYQSHNLGKGPVGAVKYFKTQDSICRMGLEYLQEHKMDLNEDDYNLLKAMALSYFLDKGRYLYMMTDSMRSLSINLLKQYNYKLPDSLIDMEKFNQLPILKYSDTYSNAIIEKYTFDSCYVANKEFSLERCYLFLTKNYYGELRQRLLTNLLYTHRSDSADFDYLLTNVRPLIDDPNFVLVLEKMRQSRIVGAKAYEFTLTDDKGKTHTMSEYKGQVVFIDFWFTGCGNCARVAPYLERIEKKFKDAPVKFLSVNLDKTKTRWLNSIKTHIYTSPYVTNLFTEGKEFQHPISLYYSVDAGPTLILIDKKGRLMRNPIDPREDNGENLVSLINEGL